MDNNKQHEYDSDSLTVLTDRLFCRVAAWFRANSIPFISTLIIGLLAHGFAFANKLPNHDDVFHIFEKGNTVDSGRWALSLLSPIFPDFSMPWIYGILSIVMLAFVVCLLTKLFQVRSKVLQILLGGVLVAFPSLTGTFSYMFTVSPYMLAMLMAVGAVYLISRPGRWWRIPAALILQVLSVGIYQAYIAVTASLLVIHLIYLLLTEQTNVKKAICRGVLYVVFLGLSLGMYWIVNKIFLQTMGLQMNAYASNAFQEGDLLGRIISAYDNFFKAFTTGEYALFPTAMGRKLHILCLILILVEMVCRLYKKPVGCWLMILALVAILPLAINCMFLISKADAIHTLVLYSHASIYVLAVVILGGQLSAIGKRAQALCSAVVALCMALTIMSNVYAANQAYLNMHLRYENTYAVCTTLAAQIQSTPGFTAMHPVYLCGTYQSPEFYDNFSDTENITGTSGLSMNMWSIRHFLRNYCGFNTGEPVAEHIAAVESSEAFHNMPCYPAYGSVQMINGVLVVKFS